MRVNHRWFALRPGSNSSGFPPLLFRGRSRGFDAGDCCVACVEHHAAALAAGRPGCGAWTLHVSAATCLRDADTPSLVARPFGAALSGRRPEPRPDRHEESAERLRGDASVAVVLRSHTRRSIKDAVDEGSAGA